MKEMHKDFEKILSKSDSLREHCMGVVKNLSELDEDKLFNDIEEIILHLCSRFMVLFSNYSEMPIEDIVISISKVLENDISDDTENALAIKSSVFAIIIYYAYLYGFNIFIETISVIEQGLINIKNENTHA